MGVYKAAGWANQEERIPAGYTAKSGDGLLSRLRNALKSPESSSELRPCAQL